jgi:hypothetical protein
LSTFGRFVGQVRHRAETWGWSVRPLAARQLRRDLLRAQRSWRSPASSRFGDHEKRVFSQNGEDGVLEHVFTELGIADGFAVEIGAADGQENCTRNLIEAGWSGVWIEGDPELCQKSRELFPDGRVHSINAMVDARSVTELLEGAGVAKEFDLLVLDVDGPDYGILRSILGSYRPTVVVHEYNGEHSYAWECRRAGAWDYDWDFGATLESFAHLLEPAGYSLIGCESQGVNAFWVRADRLSGALTPGPVSELKVSPRHRGGLAGHARRNPFQLVATDPITDDELSTFRFRSFAPLEPQAVRAGAKTLFVGDVHNGMSRPASTELAPVSGDSYPMFLTYTILDEDDEPLEGHVQLRTPLNAVIPPGGTRPMAVEVLLPSRSGAFRIAFHVVQDGVASGDYAREDAIRVDLD